VLAPLPETTSVVEETFPTVAGEVADDTFGRFVTDCITFVPFNAVIGDAAAQELWARAGQSTATLTVECQIIAVNPIAREALQSQMTQLEQFFAAVAAAESTSPSAALSPPQP
jgi:hypothetical protein